MSEPRRRNRGEGRGEGQDRSARRPATARGRDRAEPSDRVADPDPSAALEPDEILPAGFEREADADEPELDEDVPALEVDQLEPFGDDPPKVSSLPVHLSLVPAYSLDADALLAADPLAAYMAHLKHFAPLPAEQQQELAERYHKTQDSVAAKLLILSNVRLVVKIAREYRRQRESLMELIQEGNVGLAEAIRRYDPYRGVKFTSYAQYWIRAMILNYLMNAVQPLRIGSTRAGRKLFFNLQRERQKLIAETHAQPSTRLLADRLGVDEAEVVNVMRVIDAPPLSIDAPAPGYERTTLGAVLEDQGSPSPEADVVSADLRENLHQALHDFGETLTDEREKAIWTGRVLAEEPRSLQELGEAFNVSRERIRQIEAKLKKRVEEYLRERFGDDELSLAVTDL